MSTLTAPPMHSRPARRAIATMYAGLALTVIAALAVLVDHLTGDVLGAHARQSYADADPAELARDMTALRSYLYGVAAFGVCGWLWMTWAIRRGKRWARAAATVLFVVASGIALFDLVVEEYGNRLLPSFLGIAGVLPCVAGLIAVVLLWLPGTQDFLVGK